MLSVPNFLEIAKGWFQEAKAQREHDKECMRKRKPIPELVCGLGDDILLETPSFKSTQELCVLVGVKRLRGVSPMSLDNTATLSA